MTTTRRRPRVPPTGAAFWTFCPTCRGRRTVAIPLLRRPAARRRCCGVRIRRTCRIPSSGVPRRWRPRQQPASEARPTATPSRSTTRRTPPPRPTAVAAAPACRRHRPGGSPASRTVPSATRSHWPRKPLAATETEAEAEEAASPSHPSSSASRDRLAAAGGRPSWRSSSSLPWAPWVRAWDFCCSAARTEPLLLVAVAVPRPRPPVPRTTMTMPMPMVLPMLMMTLTATAWDLRQAMPLQMRLPIIRRRSFPRSLL
mmetsp:Transcript_5607/g.13450  ORF Transcript_5607/g.13450 Transcript_5607/m.13450 type:complete len:257 (+) Transcript_5607:280-1050(+)